MACKPAMFFGLMTFLLCQVTCRSIAPTIVAHPVGEIDGEESPCIKAISASTTEMPRSPTKGLSKAGSLHHHVKRTTKFAKSIYRAFHLRQRKPHSTSRKPLSSDRDDIPDEDKCCVCLERILHSPSTADRGRGRGMRWEGGDPIHRDCEEKLVALSSDRNPHPEPEEELSDSDDIPDEDKCCLCLERILHSPSTADRGRGRGIRWRCGHPIHRDCEEKLVATEFTTCPVCRIDLDGRRQDTTAPPAHIAVALEEGHHIPAISTGQNYGTSHFEQPRMGRSATLPTRPGIPSPPGRHQLTRSTTFPMVDGRPSRMTEELGSEVAYVGEDGRHDIIESHSPLAMVEAGRPTFGEQGSFHWQYRAVPVPGGTLYIPVPAPAHFIPLHYPPHGPDHGVLPIPSPHFRGPSLQHPFPSPNFRGPWPHHMMDVEQGQLQSADDLFLYRAYFALFLLIIMLYYLS